MNLTLSEEQEQLVASARRFLERSCTTTVVREIEASVDGHDPDLWDRAALLGWPGLVLPEDHGGSGQGIVELSLLAEELGRAPYPSPLVTSTTLAALPILWGGTAAQRRRLLPGLAEGTSIGSLALLEPQSRDEWSRVEVRGRRAGPGWHIAGTKILVPYAATADLLVVATDLEALGTSLVVVGRQAPGIRLSREAALGGDPLYEVAFDDVAIDTGSVLARGGDAAALLGRALDRAAVAGVAYAAGLAGRALELSVQHAKDRVQFGRQIGSFQAISHRCADMRADLDAVRLLAYQAAWVLDQGLPADLEVAAAKAYANDAVRRIFAGAHQVHGAIGFSMEHDLQLYTRRAKAFELSLGGVERHRARVWRHMAPAP